MGLFMPFMSKAFIIIVILFTVVYNWSFLVHGDSLKMGLVSEINHLLRELEP